MTQLERESLQAISTHPAYQILKHYMIQEIDKYRLSPIDRSQNIEAQALAREDASKIISDVLSQVDTLATKELAKKVTYE